MLRTYFIQSFRSLVKRPLYSFINIAGLTLGIAVCLVIWKYVEFELSYDRFHTNGDDIYRTTFTEYGKDWKDDWFSQFGYGLGPAIIEEVPEIKNYVRIHPLYGDVALISYTNQAGELNVFNEENIYFADSSFFDVFSYPIVKGNAAGALDHPSSVVISQTLAGLYFGNIDPIGKTLHIKTKDWVDEDFTVTAIMEDIRSNSHLQFDMLLSMHNLLQSDYYRDVDNAWGAVNFTTYLQMSPGTDVTTLTAKTKQFMDKHTGTDPLGVRLRYQPLLEINFSPDLNRANGHLNSVYFFLLISIFVLGIAWINYVNLSTARAAERAREVGVKKAMGVSKNQLITQFLFESLLINFISIVMAVGIAYLWLPLLANLIDKNIQFDFSQPFFWLVLTGLFFLGSLISGAYPAFVLSSLKTTDIMKGLNTSSGNGLILRKFLVIFQFTASLLLIAGTFVIHRQMNFMLQRDKGFTIDQMLIVNGPQILNDAQSVQRLLSFKNELLKLTSVQRVTTSGTIPGGGYSFTTGMHTVGKEKENTARESVHVVWVDPDFLKSYGMKIIAGKTWDPNSASSMEAVFINEAALSSFELGTAEEALNEKLMMGDGGEPLAIQGVVKNFHWNSPKWEYVPMLFRPQEANHNLFSIKLTSNVHASVEQIEKIYKNLFPGNPFSYYFLDDFFNSQFSEEQQFGSLFGVFSLLAIVIACLGLWGLASFTTTQRMKEISIRKILGASVANIVSMLSLQFMILIGISALIAIPIIWFVAKEWIGNFAFKIAVTADLFLIPLIALILVALSTVSLQIYRGANTNPAEVLRSE